MGVPAVVVSGRLGYEGGEGASSDGVRRKGGKGSGINKGLGMRVGHTKLAT